MPETQGGRTGSPVVLACPECGGGSDRCEACGGTGKLRITTCPNKLLPAEVGEFFFYFDLLKTALPEPGGLRSQTRCFLDGVRFAQAEEARWKAAVRAKD